MTVVGRLRYTYEIIAGGAKWEDCAAVSITIEAVAA